MRQEHTVGIDIGTHSIKIVIAEVNPLNQSMRIIHTVEHPTYGFRHGYIVDAEQAFDSFSQALHKAEKEYGYKINKARFSIGGVGLKSQYVRTSFEDVHGSEIQERHVDEVVQKAEDLFTNKYPNKKILHIIPVKYRVDGKDVLGTPIGMYGNSIEIKVIFITLLEHHYDAFVSLIQKSEVGILDIIASPIADGAVALSYKQKTQGCMIINIGSETTSLSTFENGIITSLDIYDIGSNNISNDIALGLQIPLDDADKIKRGVFSSDYPRRKVDEIIYARLADILEIGEKHLLRIKKNRLLPAGVIFTGGGSHIENIIEYAKQELKLPAEVIHMTHVSKKTKRTSLVPHQFSVAVGLCTSEGGHQTRFKPSLFSFKNIKRFFRQLLGELTP